MKLTIRRFYLEEFNEQKHESTASIETIDLCNDCLDMDRYTVQLFEEEELTPPDMNCDLCGETNY